jgi:hypothetical protein
MSKILINLLPPEIQAERSKTHKTTLVSQISFSTIAAAIIISFAVVTLSVLATLNFQKKTEQLKNSQERVASFKDTEGLMVVLKNRVADINTLMSQDSVEGAMFIAINKITPLSIRLFTFGTEKKGSVNVAGETNDTQALDEFINGMLTIDVPSGKIAGGTVNSLNQNANGMVRFDITLNIAQ